MDGEKLTRWRQSPHSLLPSLKLLHMTSRARDGTKNDVGVELMVDLADALGRAPDGHTRAGSVKQSL